MKIKLLKSFLFTSILVLSLSTFAFANTTGNQINKQIDGVQATLTFVNEELKPGSNEFTIYLLDENGDPISDDNLKVTADMDRSTDMGNDGMEKDEPMIVDLKEGSQKGEYSGMVDFKNKGEWIIKATFNVQGQEKNIDFDFHVESAGPNYFIIGGFLGVIVLIIIIAAINKKKSIKA